MCTRYKLAWLAAKMNIRELIILLLYGWPTVDLPGHYQVFKEIGIVTPSVKYGVLYFVTPGLSKEIQCHV